MGMRGWKKRVMAIGIATVLGCALMPRAAQATTTRIYTLGAMNRFIVDDTNRWLYPHAITKYGNLFYVELFGSTPSQNFSSPGSNRGAVGPAGQTLDIVDAVPVQETAGGGAIIEVANGLFISAHLSDYENPTVPAFLALLGQSSQGDPSAFPWVGADAPDGPAAANRKFDIFGAYSVSDKLQLGLQFTYGSSKYSRNPNANDPMVGTIQDIRRADDIGASELAFLLSGGLAPSDALAIDAAFGLRIHSLTYRPNNRQLVEGGGGLELSFDARSMIGVTKWWELVPAVSFRLSNFTAADLGDFNTGLIYGEANAQQTFFITDVRAGSIAFDLGLAGHFKPTETVSFWAAGGFHVASFSTEYENQLPDDGVTRDQALEFFRSSTSFDALPYLRIALEARIFSWLDFRGGVVKYIRADTVETRADEDNDPAQNLLNDVTRDYPFFDYFLGLALHYEGFFLDMQLDPFWFMRGPEFLSGAGAGTGNSMFINSSLGYSF